MRVVGRDYGKEVYLAALGLDEGPPVWIDALRRDGALRACRGIGGRVAGEASCNEVRQVVHAHRHAVDGPDERSGCAADHCILESFHLTPIPRSPFPYFPSRLDHWRFSFSAFLRSSIILYPILLRNRSWTSCAGRNPKPDDATADANASYEL